MSRTIHDIADPVQRVAAIALHNARHPTAFVEGYAGVAQADLRDAEAKCKAVGIDPERIALDGTILPPPEPKTVSRAADIVRQLKNPPRPWYQQDPATWSKY